MPLSTLAAATAFERGGFTFRPLAVPSRGSAELAVWALDVRPGASSEAHRMDREEVFVVVTGAVTARIGGEELTAAAGDALIVPPHTELELRNHSAEHPATLTVATSAGMRAILGEAVFDPPWAR